MRADEETGFIWPFDLHAVSSDVASAGFRVLSDDIGGCEKWPRVLADSPDRHRQFENVDLIAVKNVFLARSGFDGPRWDWMLQCPIPLSVDSFNRLGFQTYGVNLSRGPEHPRGHWHTETFDVLEQQSRTFFSGYFFKELAANRGELPVLVHFLSDSFELAALFKHRQIFAQ